jgi:predicted nucleotidyltransferase
MSNELTESELITIRGILSAIPSLDKAVLFGSRATGHARYNSDVDIMLYGDQLSVSDICHIQTMLYDTDMPYLFDLLMRRAVKNEILLEDIKREGQVIYQNGSPTRQHTC